jgi:hypothetical protein
MLAALPRLQQTNLIPTASKDVACFQNRVRVYIDVILTLLTRTPFRELTDMREMKNCDVIVIQHTRLLC